MHSWELCFPFLILYRNSRRWSLYSDRTTLSLFKFYFVNQMRASLNIDLRHDHITSSDCFSSSIPTEVLEVSILIIDTFDSWVLSLSHSEYKKNVNKVEQSQPQWQGQDCLHYRQRLGDLGWFSQEKEWLWEDSTAAVVIYGHSTRKIGLGCSQQCMVGGWGTADFETREVQNGQRFSKGKHFPMPVQQWHKLYTKSAQSHSWRFSRPIWYSCQQLGLVSQLSLF